MSRQSQPPARANAKSTADSWSHTSENAQHVNLHAAAASGDLDAIVKAYLAEQSMMERDREGNTPLHFAARNDHRSAARGLMALAMPETSWIVKNNAGQTPIDLASPKIKKDMLLISLKRTDIADQHTQFNKRLVEQRLAQPNKNHKVLLSIDGGGIKAILIAGTILAIERAMGEGETLMEKVHWLGGTSCGGIISLIFGCGYSCEQARKLFIREKLEVFCGNKAAFPKHSSQGIERTLKKYLGIHTRMSDIKMHKIMVTAAKVKCAPSTLVLFRNYTPRMSPQEFEKYGFLNPENILVWKAARSTSAAPVYFESFHGLADGAIVCNNPCLTLMTDFFRLKKLENFKNIPNHDEIGTVLSLGSGTEPVVPLGGIDINLTTKLSINKYWDVFGKGKNLLTLFMYQCTSSHAVSAGQAREWAHSLGVPYFRFSPKLSRSIELDSTSMEAIFDFMFENEVYLRTQVRHELEDLARLLKSMPKHDVIKPKDVIH